MRTQLKSNLSVARRAGFTNPPQVSVAPVLAGVNAGQPVVLSAVGGVSGTPDPTITYALQKNSVTVLTGPYAAVNSVYTNTLLGDVLIVIATAANGFGTPVVEFSNSITVGTTQSFVPTILAAPVIGQPLGYVTPGYTGTISSQQWYRNKGSGPVLIPGATGATYTPTKTSALGGSDVAAWFSVGVVTPTGNARSQEFAALNQKISQSAVLTTPSPMLGCNYLATEATAVTILTVSKIRLTTNGTTSYIDTIVAPGTYAGGSATFGDPSLVSSGGTIYGCNVYTYLSLCPPACIDAIADSTPVTTTRPAASTGVGFFNRGGELYDANGNKTRLRGFNRNHYDANPPGASSGVFNAKANAHRLNIYLHRDWTTVNKPLMDDMVSTTHKVVPIPGVWYINGVFMGTVSGNTLTVISMTSGVIPVAPGFSSSGGSFVAAGISTSTTIAAQLTNTNPSGIPGREGTYTLSNSYSISSPISMSYTNSCTGLTNPEIIIAAAQAWCDQYAKFAPYERWMILNIGNEWGPSGSASNTVWRDTYITCVQMLRTAGYKCPIMIDAPGNGQDGGSSGRAWTLLNHAAAVLAADSQSNTMFSLHCYGLYQAGALAPIAAQLRALATSQGITFVVGEFGPANMNVGPGSITTAQLQETTAVLEASQLGYLAWAWDDPASASGSGYGYTPYALCQMAGSNYYSASDSAQLTTPGQQFLLDPVNGLAARAVAATVFP